MAIYNNTTDPNVTTWEKQNTKTYTLYATIRIEIESELQLDEAIDEFQSNCMYDFPDTEKCNVILTRWEDTSL